MGGIRVRSKNKLAGKEIELKWIIWRDVIMSKNSDYCLMTILKWWVFWGNFSVEFLLGVVPTDMYPNMAMI